MCLQLPNNRTIAEFEHFEPGYTESIMPEGMGFGFGVSVTLAPSTPHSLKPQGAYGWGGMANTVFVCDPKEGMSYMLMTQIIGLPVHKRMETRSTLDNIVYGSLCGSPGWDAPAEVAKL